MYHVAPLQEHMHLDASLQDQGWVAGWIYKNYVYALVIPLNFRQYNIAHLEMVNVVVALKVWGQLWANKHVEICCDNRAVVDVLSFGKVMLYWQLVPGMYGYCLPFIILQL